MRKNLFRKGDFEIFLFLWTLFFILGLTVPFIRTATAEDDLNLLCGTTIFVDINARGRQDGTSWQDAFTAIQAGIDSAEDGDIVIVAEGTYFENIDFSGKNITLKSTDPDNPDVVAATVIDGGKNGTVVTFSGGEDAGCILTGFTITNGCTEGGDWPESCSGGIYCWSSPTITNNIITRNSADYGGGIFSWAAPTITNNTVTRNTAIYDGGGIYCYERGTISNNIITKNTAQRGGGIFTSEDLEPVITNNIISGNRAEEEGGGIGSHNNSPTIIGNLIVGNSTAGEGGGIYLKCNASEITNNIISGNRAAIGGGLCSYVAAPALTNCILWDNIAEIGPEIMMKPQDSRHSVSNLSVNYCDVSGGAAEAYVGQSCNLKWGTGNIDLDPHFVEPGYWDSNNTPDDPGDDYWVVGDYHLLPDSPCIDTGDPDLPLDPDGTRPDIGAASIPPTVDITCPDPASGVISVYISSSDNSNFIYSILYVDGGFIGRKKRIPRDIKWNTKKSANGHHILSIRAYHQQLQKWFVGEKTVEVQN